jgi:hypothetical protein
MQPKRNRHNKLDLVGYLGVRVRKYRLDLGVGHLELVRLRTGDPEVSEGSEARHDDTRILSSESDSCGQDGLARAA